ncbi:MAG TPA: phosphotransferase [Aquabacterium sp.]|uniref:aminoglycoside phosphotransferase family protein n=1 Tax=Aquabacterium sp. TaxID=1872578 RepID=UPI002E30B2FD|nr:phosphotransferase [Aquabacterium sp.]HEX5373048.1 phosphotransferase [Aquabacterium sp.]
MSQTPVSQHDASSSSPLQAFGVPWSDPVRLAAFQTWLNTVSSAHGLQLDSLRAASADASFRRYLRVDTVSGGSLIIMDAPPSHEDCRPFVAIDRLLRAGGVAAPEILSWDEGLGFMLLSDLGQHTLLSTLVVDAAEHSAQDLGNQARYGAALDELVALQRIAAQGAVPAYDDALLQRELDLFPQWYLTQLRGLSLDEGQQAMLAQTFALIKSQVLSQPAVLVHRDYHSRNLMACPDDPRARPGVIDFQDAVWGPITYDLVSLLRDAYVIWDEERQIDYAVRYWQKARAAELPVHEDFGEFWREFEWMGLQRHLKVLGIFARLALRDGKRQYLDDIPRVWTYAHRVASRYQGLGPLSRLLEQAEAAHGGIQTQVGYTF